MRFALLGESPVATAVARAVAASDEHRLVRLAGLSEGAAAGFPAQPERRQCRGWEELLTDPNVDAVIVAGSREDLQSVVRQLLQAGRSVLVEPELVQPASFFYELALFDAESPGKLFPLSGLRGHPQVAQLAQLVSESRLGPILHVQVERTIASSVSGDGRAAPGLMSHSHLTSALLTDADLLRGFFGGYDQVAASRSGDAAAGYSLATVTLNGDSVPQAVWTAVGGSPQAGWKLTCFCESGSALLEGSPEQYRLRLTINGPDRAPDISETTTASGDWLLEQFVAQVQRQAAGPEAQSATSLWDDLACAVELVDAVERSVRRRRTIDVHFETPSERGLFKTQMTAVGCSLLMLTLVAVVLYLVLEASIDMPPVVRQILVVLIFAPLGVFLALQLLYFVARPASRD